MAELALNNIIVILTVYSAGLIFALQHVADRFSPHLMKPLLLRIGLWAPLVLVLQGAMTIILALNPFPTSNVLASLLLLAAVFVGLGMSFWMWYRIANGTKMLAWLWKQHKQPEFLPALQEIALKAIQRGDQPVTAAALRMGLHSGAASEELFLQWLVDHRDMMQADWLLRALLTLLLADKLNESRACYELFDTLLAWQENRTPAMSVMTNGPLWPRL